MKTTSVAVGATAGQYVLDPVPVNILDYDIPLPGHFEVSVRDILFIVTVLVAVGSLANKIFWEGKRRGRKTKNNR